MRNFAIVLVACATLCLPVLLHAGQQRPTLAPLCAGCHQPEPGVFMGTLDNISYKANTIQLDLVSHKELIRFDDDTKVKNIGAIEELKNYRNRAFQVNFVPKKGENVATAIIRFDVLKALKPEDKLDREGLKKLMAGKKNLVLVDARPVARYDEGHIPGAIVIPAAAFDKQTDKLPRDKKTPLVFYCVGGCSSPIAAVKARSLGYSEVKVYVGGMPDWVKTEYTVITPSYLKNAIEQSIPHVLIDTRGRAAAAKGHIMGALVVDLASARNSFPRQKNAPIIFYGPGAAAAASQVIGWGYTGVKLLPLSFEEWQKGGNSVAAGPAGSIIAYTPKAKPGTITPDEFTRLAGAPPADMVVIDVRNPEEYAANHVANAMNIPLDDLNDKLAEFPKGKKPLLYCDTGMRAEMAHIALKEKGIDTRFLDATIKFGADGTFAIVAD